MDSGNKTYADLKMREAFGELYRKIRNSIRMKVMVMVIWVIFGDGLPIYRVKCMTFQVVL